MLLTICSRPPESATYTAFMYMGELIEFGETKKMFISPAKKQTEDYITGRFG